MTVTVSHWEEKQVGRVENCGMVSVLTTNRTFTVKWEEFSSDNFWLAEDTARG